MKPLLHRQSPPTRTRYKFCNFFLAKSYDGVSLSEKIAEAVPNAHVVKAFNMCQAKVWEMKPPVFDGNPLVVMYCGDNNQAKEKVAVLIKDVGCEAKDIGDLKYARMLEPAAAIVIKLGSLSNSFDYSRYEYHWFSSNLNCEKSWCENYCDNSH
ncbi:MAG: hypothetical protein AAF630_19255 [Cyanobacteria bacterium P01_C01_bin.38]